MVPLTASEPREPRASHVSFNEETYLSLKVRTWAICEMLAHVSHRRLDRVRVSGQYLSEGMTDADILRVETGLRHALGFSED